MSADKHLADVLADLPPEHQDGFWLAAVLAMLRRIPALEAERDKAQKALALVQRHHQGRCNMSTDKHPAEVLADRRRIEGPLSSWQREAEAMLRRMSASEAALLDALERAESSMSDFKCGLNFVHSDQRTLVIVRDLIARND